jgi:hypothetical protein
MPSPLNGVNMPSKQIACNDATVTGRATGVDSGGPLGFAIAMGGIGIQLACPSGPFANDLYSIYADSGWRAGRDRAIQVIAQADWTGRPWQCPRARSSGRHTF